MVEPAIILTARRAYEFAMDDLRLSLLSNRAVLDHVRTLFSFEIAQTGVPAPLFGPVPSTIPPGLVFDYGLTPFPSSPGTALRFIHVEARRIVIDVAGPSAVIAPTFERLRSSLADLTDSSGRPAIGDPTHTRDYSEIVAHLDFDPDQLLPAGLREAIQPARVEGARGALVPALTIQFVEPNAEFQGTMADITAAALELRAGTRPAERTYFSRAPLTTEAHIDYLHRIEEAIVGSVPDKRPAGQMYQPSGRSSQ